MPRRKGGTTNGNAEALLRPSFAPLAAASHPASAGQPWRLGLWPGWHQKPMSRDPPRIAAATLRAGRLWALLLRPSRGPGIRGSRQRPSHLSPAFLRAVACVGSGPWVDRDSAGSSPIPAVSFDRLFGPRISRMARIRRGVNPRDLRDPRLIPSEPLRENGIAPGAWSRYTGVSLMATVARYSRAMGMARRPGAV
jgi:hypothetical protein